MISIGQGLEHSTDMEMVDLSTYVPHLSPVTQQYFIRYSGRIMATYSGLTTVERPFILAPYPNLTPESCHLFQNTFLFSSCQLLVLLLRSFHFKFGCQWLGLLLSPSISNFYFIFSPLLLCYTLVSCASGIQERPMILPFYVQNIFREQGALRLLKR